MPLDPRAQGLRREPVQRATKVCLCQPSLADRKKKSRANSLGKFGCFVLHTAMVADAPNVMVNGSRIGRLAKIRETRIIRFMDIREYIAEHGVETCAKAWGMTARAVKGYRYGERCPSPAAAAQIERLTGGEVTFAECFAAAVGKAASTSPKVAA